MRALLLVTLGIAACHSAARPDDLVDQPAIDAAPDAPCGDGYVRYPITATGSTPAGALDDYHYAEASFDCHWYTVVLSHTRAGSSCSSDRWMYIQIHYPTDGTQPPSGSFPTDASELTSPISDDSIDSAQISFEASVIDPPSLTDEMHLDGHLVANASGWLFDLPIDLYASPGIGSCTL